MPDASEAVQPDLVAVPGLADAEDLAVPGKGTPVEAGRQPGRVRGQAGVVDVGAAVGLGPAGRVEGLGGGVAGEQVDRGTDTQRVGVLHALRAGGRGPRLALPARDRDRRR